MHQRLFVLLVVLAFLGNVALTAGLFRMGEDGHITLRYARNLADGNGPVFNPGEKVEGYTNPLWMALLAVGIEAGADPVLWAQGITGLCALALLLFLGLCWPATRAAVIPLALNVDMALHVVNGMETLGFMLLTAVGARQALKQRTATAAAAWATAWMLRSDAPAYVGIALLAIAVHQVTTGDRWKAVLGRSVKAGALVVLFYAPLLVWRWRYYGYPLPNTYYAKVEIPFAWNILFGARYFLHFAREYFPWWIAVAVMATAGWRRRTPAVAAFAVGGALTIAYVVYVGGDTSSTGVRFFLPMIVAGWVVTASLPKKAYWAALALLAAQVAWTDGHRIHDQLEYREKSLPGGYTTVGRAFHRYIPAGTTLALEPVGEIGFATPGLVIFDLLGLTNAQVAHGREFGSVHRGKGHVKVGYQTALAGNVDCFWFQQIVKKGPTWTATFSFADEPLTRLRTDPRFADFHMWVVPIEGTRLGAVVHCKPELRLHDGAVDVTGP